ncbi:MAG: Gfo/Idh/MocA family oxidoreductase [Blastocatellia bacterium]|nr:Gfo/Idh/MocA family oxidoreductase [Blastocatellia bacterium]
MSNSIERRSFIKGGIATGITAAAAGNKILGASDRIRVGVIGLGREGRGVMKAFARNSDVEIAAICDVYEPHLAAAIKEAKLEGVRTFKDFRRLLEIKDLDAVLVATPDHWHALNMIMACQANKDVYVEKPISVTVEEGRKMVQAARKYNRIVQVGTQQRSGDHYQKAAEIVQGGQIGKVTAVHSWNYENSAPDGIGHPADGNPPEGLDWDFWLGPAPLRPFNANRFGVAPNRWSTFRYFWDYAGGMMTDWGVHHLDIVQMVMGVDAPLAVSASGGKYVLHDNRETPDTLTVTYEYPGFLCTYENREGNGQTVDGHGYGITFYGTDATLFIDREYFEISQEKAGKGAEPTRVKGKNKQGDEHVRNFLDCVKTRKLPISDIEIGHRSTTTALLGNVALRSARRIEWNAKLEKLEGDQAGAKYLAREYRKPWKLNV